MASMLAEDLRRGGVEGNFTAVLVSCSASSVASEVFNGGVGFPELLVGESVDILSLSLSRSSPIVRVELWLRLRECSVKDDAKGLWCRVANILDLRKRWRRAGGSSRVKAEVDALEPDDGR